MSSPFSCMEDMPVNEISSIHPVTLDVCLLDHLENSLSWSILSSPLALSIRLYRPLPVSSRPESLLKDITTFPPASLPTDRLPLYIILRMSAEARELLFLSSPRRVST